MPVQSQDLEHAGNSPEVVPQEQKGVREGKHQERDKGTAAPKNPAAPKDRVEGAYSGNNTPSRPD
jgi:hypothetical protein